MVTPPRIVKGVATVGALNRQNVRNALFSLDLTFVEDKGLLDSTFRYQGLAHNVGAFHTYMMVVRSRQEREDRMIKAAQAELRASKRWWKPSTWFY